jgi:hypothetical protein
MGIEPGKLFCHGRANPKCDSPGKGADVRYVVTNIKGGGARHLYERVYCARGQAENLIKRHKSQLASDRTSCRSPSAFAGAGCWPIKCD